MLVHRSGIFAGEGYFFFEEVNVARLFDIAGGRIDQPEVVVAVFVVGRIGFLVKRRILVIGAPIF